MKLSEVSYKLHTIFKQRLNFDFEEKKEYKNLSFFGKELQFSARDLVLVLFDIEKAFNILIPKEFVVEGKFDNYIHVEELVVKQCPDYEC